MLTFFLLTAASAQETPRLSLSVGMTGKLTGVVLPGPELVVRPIDDWRCPLVLRIASVRRHGSAHRYDLELYGTVPGRHDLRDYLQRADGSAASGLPALWVEIRPAFPRSEQRRVAPSGASARPALGGYRFWLMIAGVAWAVGLVGLLVIGGGRRRETAAVDEAPETLADRLRPLVERAAAGTLAGDDTARLERLLFAVWREREGLDGIDLVEGLRTLRTHPEAGPLLTALERWLHQPPGTAEAVDVEALLAPYRQLDAPAEPAE